MECRFCFVLPIALPAADGWYAMRSLFLTTGRNLLAFGLCARAQTPSCLFCTFCLDLGGPFSVHWNVNIEPLFTGTTGGMKASQVQRLVMRLLVFDYDVSLHPSTRQFTYLLLTLCRQSYARRVSSSVKTC